MSNPDINLFRDEEFEEVRLTPEKVVCLGVEFESDDARRAYFREELRKKLPELRQIEGFPIGEDEDIINLSDPPYYTACPNPWLNDFVAEWEQEKVELERQGKRSAEFEVNEPYASDVSEGKNNPIYNAHSYHTKVPHPAIMRYILHYTQPGDIVFDGFAGTGMTGVAAGFCENPDSILKDKINNDFISKFETRPCWGKRHSILTDLSPIASFIAYNNNNNANLKESIRFSNQLAELKDKYNYLYQTKHVNGKYGYIEYVVWSDVIICDNCQHEMLFFNTFVRRGEGRIVEGSLCPNCASTIYRKKCKKKHIAEYDSLINKTVDVVEIKPVLICYKYANKRYFKEPDDEDFKLIETINRTEIPQWVPTTLLNDGDKMTDPHSKGVYYTHQFYFKRALIVLSELWNSSSLFNRRFITNSISRNLTKLNRFIVNTHNPNGRINGPLSGTFYIPSEIVEQNVFEILNYKQNDDVLNSFNTAIQVASANGISNIQSNSIDYIFTDPPFGSNIMYSELNSISESWLQVFTNNKEEAIENKYQNKSTLIYQEIMSKCFVEFYRILKPNKWMTVEFSNTSASIWNAIQYAIKSAGFIISNVSALDKVHGGIKSMRYTTSVKEDLVITCYKPTEELTNKIKDSIDKSTSAMDFIEELLYHLPVHLEKNNSTTAVIERSPKILYDRLISYYVQHGYAIPMDAQEFQKALRERFIERDGMFFTASQTVEYEAKKEKTDGVVPMALFISSEAEGIEWLKRELAEPQTYQEILPNWMKDMVAPKKGDVLPELATILEENFIKDEDGKWRKPDAEKAADLEILRGKKLMKEFNLYLEQASKPKAKRMKDTRLEVLRYGFKECYKQKNYQAIVTVGDHIQESLLQEDEVLLQYYDIASMRV